MDRILWSALSCLVMMSVSLQACDPSAIDEASEPRSTTERLRCPPGQHGHGVLQLSIDLAHDSYTAPCRPAAWHGGSAI
jgi:hypothetical protein